MSANASDIKLYSSYSCRRVWHSSATFGTALPPSSAREKLWLEERCSISLKYSDCHQTLTLPKPLVEFANKPMIEHQVENLAAAGVTDIVLAVNYRPEIMAAALKKVCREFGFWRWLLGYG